jgi:hypothetical protein
MKYKIEPFLERAVNQTELTDSELDAIYDYLNNSFRKNEFEVIDRVFNYLNRTFDTLNVCAILGLLTASYPAKSKLKGRADFYMLAEAKFGKDLLKGLE